MHFLRCKQREASEKRQREERCNETSSVAVTLAKGCCTRDTFLSEALVKFNYDRWEYSGKQENNEQTQSLLKRTEIWDARRDQLLSFAFPASDSTGGENRFDPSRSRR